MERKDRVRSCKDHHHEKGEKKVIIDQNNNTNQKDPLYLSRQVIPYYFLYLGKGGEVDIYDFLSLYIAF